MKEGIKRGELFEGRQLSMLVRECDTEAPKAFFPLTVALRRLGFKVLYYGFEPELVENSGGELSGLSNSYVVTERPDPCVGLNVGNAFVKKECWVLPLTAHKHLLSFQGKTFLPWEPLCALTLWDSGLAPENFPMAQYIDVVAIQSKDIAQNSTNAQLEHKVNTLKKALYEKEQAVFGLELVVAQGDSDLKVSATALKNAAVMVKEATELCHSLDRELDDADETNKSIVNELQEARKQAHDRADVIIKMAEATKGKVKARGNLQAYEDANKWQADKIRSLLKANDILKLRVTDQTEQVNTGPYSLNGKPVYEVNASKEVSLSSFKMSTIATAIRWGSTAAMVGSVAYAIVG